MNIEKNNLSLVDQTSLDSAIYTSLTAKRRADSKNGYWADPLNPYVCGSLLWTLGREALTDQLTPIMEQHIRDALQWLVLEGIAQRVDVKCQTNDRDVMIINVAIDGNLKGKYELQTRKP